MGSNHLYKIVLADDHRLVRQGIKRIIEEDGKMKVIGEAGDGIELLEILEKVHPDLVICDIAMPRLRGLEAAQRVKNLYPDIKVLILTLHNRREYVDRARLVGAEGYLLKDEMDRELLAAIAAVRRGGTYLSPLLEDNGFTTLFPGSSTTDPAT